MSALTIPNIDPETVARLHLRAAQEGLSVEDHVRALIAGDTSDVQPTSMPGTFADHVQALFGDVGGIELQLPARVSQRDPPDFGDPQVA